MHNVASMTGDPGRPSGGAFRFPMLAVVAGLLLLPTPAAAAPDRAKPWPPRDLPGKLFAHFGEEHVNDADGATLLPLVRRGFALRVR
jgi:hypothetical protein